MKPRAAVLAVAGAAALAVAAALAPRVYERIRIEVLIRRLEAGPDPAAAKELARAQYAWRIHERFRALEGAARARVAAPLWDLAMEGPLEPRIRWDLFETMCPSRFVSGVKHRVVSEPGELGHPEHQQIALVVRDGVSRLVATSGVKCYAHEYTVVRPPSGREVVLYVEYFMAGTGNAARLAYRRASWLLFDAGQPPGKDLRVEIEDLTDVPDLLDVYLAGASRAGPGAVLFDIEALGGWRQFLSFNPDWIERPISYGLHVEGPGGLPLLIGRIAAIGPRLGNFQPWFVEEVPASLPDLAPGGKVRVTFRPDPAFAESHGFAAPPEDSPPFERTYYLPPPKEGEPSG